MARTCTVCKNGKRDAINAALIAGTAPIRRIAADNGVTESALRRHAAKHLPATLARAQDAKEIAVADTLLGQCRELQGRTLTILDRAERSHELKTALQAIREARGLLELLAKLTGELAAQPSMQQNVVTVGMTALERRQWTEQYIVSRGGPSRDTQAELLERIARLTESMRAEGRG
jgi:hypothetical protein